MEENKAVQNKHMEKKAPNEDKPLGVFAISKIQCIKSYIYDNIY